MDIHFDPKNFQLMTSHGFTAKETEEVFPSFPSKDKNRIYFGTVTREYLNDQLDAWKGPWAIKDSLTAKKALGGNR